MQDAERDARTNERRLSVPDIPHFDIILPLGFVDSKGREGKGRWDDPVEMDVTYMSEA